MKIAINQAISLGPAAGERRVVAGLAEAMRERGDSVRFDLDGDGIDLILLAASGENDPDLTFAPTEAARYVRRHPRTVVVQRVGGQATGVTGAARRRLQAVNRLADHAVFAAAALIPAVGPRGAHTVVLNGADPRVFNPDLHRPWRGDGALRVVAVHRAAGARGPRSMRRSTPCSPIRSGPDASPSR